MKKLLVCAAALLIAILIARWRGGVAVLTPQELVDRCATGAFAELEAQGVSLPAVLAPVIGWFLEPGAYGLSRVGIDPAQRYALLVSAFAGWWLYLAAARLLWTFAARHCGIADISNFWIWLMLGPPWRPIYRVWIKVKRWYAAFWFHEGPSARWTGFLATLTLVFKRGDYVSLGTPLFCGIKLFQQIGIRGALHVLVIAASGAGKTRWLISWLGRLHRWASALIIDCDAEILKALGKPLERAGHPIFSLDPFGLGPFSTACWNAMAELDHAAARHDRKAVVRYAQTIADTLVPDDNSHQPIFAIVARNFLHGLILWVWLFEPPEQRHLVRVRELAARGLTELVIDPKQDPFAILLHSMKTSTSYDDGCDGAISDVIARAASGMESGQRAREGNSFRTSLLAATSWLDLPEMAAISKTSNFACADLKLGNAVVFLCAPVMDVRTKLSAWAALFTKLTWYTFANIDKRRKIPCSFAIDEMPSLRIPDLDVAAPVARKHGIRLVMIAQDVEKLRQAYPHSYNGFAGNAMATVWMGTDHKETLEHLSDILGTCMQKEKIEGGWFSKVPTRYQLMERKLIHPHQLRELLDPNRGWIIVTRQGKPPLKLATELPENALPVWALDPDPFFGEPILRGMSRRIRSRPRSR